MRKQIAFAHENTCSLKNSLQFLAIIQKYISDLRKNILCHRELAHHPFGGFTHHGGGACDRGDLSFVIMNPERIRDLFFV